MSDWRSLSAAELGREIGSGRADAREITEVFLDAAEAHPEIYARLTPERARDEAGAAADRSREGRRRGPLDGVPISWKDLFDTAGTPTEAGSRLLAGRTPDVDAPIVRRGTEAGLVCLGKTHLSELAFSGLGVNPATATPPNIHDPVLAPGGSSSGAAASVAFGLAAGAVGSDTGGSVRIPAAWNDLVGLKTTWGLIPMAGAVPLARSLDTAGPLARTVEDAALLHGALSGEQTEGLDEAKPGDEPLLVADTVVCDGLDPAVEEGFARTLERLNHAGVPLKHGPVAEFHATHDIAGEVSAIVNTEGWREWGARIDANPDTLYPLIEQRFRSGEGGSAERDAEAMAAFAQQRDHLIDRIEREGLICLPTVACTAPKVEALLNDHDYYVERNNLALRNTRLANLLGLCAITIPTGVAMVGLMLYGRPGDETRLLRAARGLEKVLAD